MPVVLIVFGDVILVLLGIALSEALSFHAENEVIDARKARERSAENFKGSPKAEEWSWKELRELHKVDKKIKWVCDNGCREITLNYSLKYKVVEKLKEKGYQVSIQTIDTKPIGTVIEW